VMRLCSLLCVMSVGCAAVPVRTVPEERRAFVEHAEPGVLVVALGLENQGQEVQDVQRKIITAAARNGAVLVLASTSGQQANLEEACARYDALCDRLYDGTVRVVVEPHSGVWIRDFGPYINIDRRGRVFVIDAKYDDARLRREFEYARQDINERRQALLEKRLASADKDTSLFKEQNDALLRYGAELAQLYKDEGDSRWRAMDDDAPFYIAEAGLGNDRFEIVHTPIFLDGGNLFMLQDGTCLTTTDTVAKNGGDRGLVEQELLTSYRCRRVAFLEALAGENIIKHIDMFLMPVKNKTLLIASYDPGSVRFRERFKSLDSERRQLVVASAVAMNRNKLHLKQLGYDVVEVPALFPRRFAGAIYFPTLLNGIVQVGRNGHRHLLLPDYETSDKDELAVKQAAKEVFQNTFEPGVDIQLIEATAPARLQGALHCLTNVLPWPHSVFAKDDGIAKAVRDRLSKFTPSLTSPNGCVAPLLGDWQQVRVGLDGSRSSYGPGGHAMAIEKAAARLLTDGKEFARASTLTCNPLRPNDATLKFAQDKMSATATLRHDGDDAVALQFDDGIRWVFVRPATLQAIAQKEATAAKLKSADDAFRQAGIDEFNARMAALDDDHDLAAEMYQNCSTGLDRAASLDPAVSTRKGPNGFTHAELVVRCKQGSDAMAKQLAVQAQNPADTEEGKAALDGFVLASKAMSTRRMQALELAAALKAAEACRTNTGYLLSLRLHDDKPLYDGKKAKLGELTLDDMFQKCATIDAALKTRRAFGCGHHRVTVSQERASLDAGWGPATGTSKQTFEAADCSEMPRRSVFPGASAGFKASFVRACGRDAIYVIQHDQWLELPRQRQISGECWKKGYLTFDR